MFPKSGPWALATNRSAETQGVWKEYGTFRFKIRRAYPGNAAFQKRQAELIGVPYADQIAAGKVKELDLVKEIAKLYAETIVVDWDSPEHPAGPKKVGMVPGPDGKPVRFSAKLCEKCFNDAPDFLWMVVADSTALATFQTEQVEAAAKN